jgi:hypothetical protein
MPIDPQAMQAVRKEDVTRILEQFFHSGGEAKCPAAQIGFYSDTRNRYLNCKVEDRLRPGKGHFAMADNPLGVMVFCCDEYGDCPVWQAEKTDDPIKDRVRAAYEQETAAATTKSQIESGLRIDDAGVEDSEIAGEQELRVKKLADPIAEAAADHARRNAEKRYTKGD